MSPKRNRGTEANIQLNSQVSRLDPSKRFTLKKWPSHIPLTVFSLCYKNKTGSQMHAIRISWILGGKKTILDSDASGRVFCRGMLCRFRKVPLHCLTPRQATSPRASLCIWFLSLPWQYKLSGDLLTPPSTPMSPPLYWTSVEGSASSCTRSGYTARGAPGNLWATRA